MIIGVYAMLGLFLLIAARAHLVGDVPALLAAGVLPLLLAPRSQVSDVT